MKQIPITPEISHCWCGMPAKVIDWNDNFMYQVMCDANHTMTRQCGSAHRAICKWNNAIKYRTTFGIKS
jgi:hypothetical protein